MELTAAERRARALKRLQDAKAQMQLKLNAHKQKNLNVSGQTSTDKSSGVSSQSRDASKTPKSKLFAKPYIEYDFSTMKDSKGGYMNKDDEKDKKDPTSLDNANWLESLSNQQPPYDFSDPRAPTCVECGTKELEFRLWRVFKIGVCKDCRRKYPEKFSLLTKTECKQDYLLTEPELRDKELLPHMERPNPYQSTYSNMMLYLRCQVEEFAIKKWGSLEKLDEEYEKREELKKTRKQQRFEKKLRDMRNKTRAQAITGSGRFTKHVHIWGPAESDGAGGLTRMCGGCGTKRQELKLS